MGFFKDLKQDLSQAVNELTEDAAKITPDESESVQETIPDDDVMVDTLNEEPEDAAEDIDVSKMLENLRQPDFLRSLKKRKQRKIQKNLKQSLLRKMNRKKRMRLQSSQEV